MLPARGALVAKGSAARPIVFTSAEGAPQKEDWIGLTFGSKPDPKDALDHVIVEYAGQEILADSGSCAREHRRHAISFAGGQPDRAFITNSTISHCTNGINSGWRGTPIDLAATNSFNDVTGCLLTNPPDQNNDCAARPACAAVASCGSGTMGNCGGGPSVDGGVPADAATVADAAPDKACEVLGPTGSTCSGALSLGSLIGGASVTVNRNTTAWQTADLVGSASELAIELTVPPGADYDLFVYSQCGVLLTQSVHQGNLAETLTIASASARHVIIEVRQAGAASCDPWALRLNAR
jgi:hypothetical protein